MLNNTLIGGKKRSKYHDMLWSVKYLPKFKWVHLNERLAYEKAVHMQRVRTEVAQAKRETNYLISNIEKSKMLKAMEKRMRSEGGTWEDRRVEITQKQTDEQIRRKNNKLKGKDMKIKNAAIQPATDTLLKSIFT